MTISMGGLTGGHSGTEIHRGRANANVLLGRCLRAVSARTELRLGEAAGGSKDNAIPTESRAQIVVSDEAAARALPALRLERNLTSDRQELTYQISHYVGEHFREPLTLGTLAQELGLNRYHLSHLFSEKIGQSFPAYLARIRFSCACAALAETDRPITEIAEESGFESQRTFFRVFRQQLGVTPLQYRRAARAGREPPEKVF